MFARSAARVGACVSSRFFAAPNPWESVLSRAVRIAVLDLGTNSTRLLVADVRDGQVEELERRTTITRLGQDVDRTGRLAPDAMERVYETIAGYRTIVDELHAERVVAAATSAVRDSANGDEFRATLMERYGVDAQTIPG